MNKILNNSNIQKYHEFIKTNILFIEIKFFYIIFFFFYDIN